MPYICMTGDFCSSLNVLLADFHNGPVYAIWKLNLNYNNSIRYDNFQYLIKDFTTYFSFITVKTLMLDMSFDLVHAF